MQKSFQNLLYDKKCRNVYHKFYMRLCVGLSRWLIVNNTGQCGFCWFHGWKHGCMCASHVTCVFGQLSIAFCSSGWFTEKHQGFVHVRCLEHFVCGHPVRSDCWHIYFPLQTCCPNAARDSLAVIHLFYVRTTRVKTCHCKKNWPLSTHCKVCMT